MLRKLYSTFSYSSDGVLFMSSQAHFDNLKQYFEICWTIRIRIPHIHKGVYIFYQRMILTLGFPFNDLVTSLMVVKQCSRSQTAQGVVLKLATTHFGQAFNMGSS